MLLLEAADGGEGIRDGALQARDRHLRALGLHGITAKLALGIGEKILLRFCTAFQEEPELPLVQLGAGLDAPPRWVLRERIADHARAISKNLKGDTDSPPHTPTPCWTAPER